METDYVLQVCRVQGVYMAGVEFMLSESEEMLNFVMSGNDAYDRTCRLQ